MHKTFKAAVRVTDYKLIAQCVREYTTAGKLTEREIFRLALAAEPELAFDTWSDIVKTAIERHPS
jgi:hypothetical protein